MFRGQPDAVACAPRYTAPPTNFDPGMPGGWLTVLDSYPTSYISTVTKT